MLTLEVMKQCRPALAAYPCKHFFAIFKKYASWGWNSLSELYKIHHI